MTTTDDRVDRLADKLQAFAERSAADGGMKAKLAKPLADDAVFVRKLKPSLIKARARGDAPIDEPALAGSLPETNPETPPSQHEPAAKRKRSSGGGGPNPWVIAGACLVAGIAVAKWLDWRGHAHPRG